MDGEGSVLEDPRAIYVVDEGNFLQRGQALLSGGEMQSFISQDPLQQQLQLQPEAEIKSLKVGQYRLG